MLNSTGCKSNLVHQLGIAATRELSNSRRPLGVHMTLCLAQPPMQCCRSALTRLCWTREGLRPRTPAPQVHCLDPAGRPAPHAARQQQRYQLPGLPGTAAQMRSQVTVSLRLPAMHELRRRVENLGAGGVLGCCGSSPRVLPLRQAGQVVVVVGRGARGVLECRPGDALQ
jgi:hypothetical protein